MTYRDDSNQIGLEVAKLNKLEAEARRANLKADREAGLLCDRREAEAWCRRLAGVVAAEADRAQAYIDPALPAEVRDQVAAAVRQAAQRLKAAIVDGMRQTAPEASA